jgi:hypothetical protein
MHQKIKALLLCDFLSFARKAISELEGTKIGSDPYLKYLAYELDQFANEDTRRLIINLPPGHLKTLPAQFHWRLGCWPVTRRSKSSS